MSADRFDHRQLIACKEVEIVVTDGGELILQVQGKGTDPLVLDKAQIDDELAPRE